MSRDLAEIAASGATFRLFTEVRFAEPPATVPVFPKPGTYKHPSYGEISLTPERLNNFVANFKNAVYQKHIPIDAEHQGKLSGSLGYINDLIVNSDGSVDAAVEWTDRGTRLVAADRFRYVSPEFFDRWEQPDTEVEFNDVLIGLALTTRPFFKDANGALRPLVAREGELIAPPQQEGDTHVTSGIVITGENGPEFIRKLKGHLMSDNETVQMSEPVTLKFKELGDRLTAAESARDAAETQAKTFGEQLAEMRATNELRAFTDEVRGRSDHNGVPYVGDVEHHVGMLQALPADKRQAYMERERTIAKAARAKDHGLFAELGSDAHAPAAGDTAAAKLEALAVKFAEANPGTTKEQAFVQMTKDHRDLALQMSREGRG